MEKLSVLKEKWLKNEIINLKERGISKADIACRLGVKPQYLNNVTNGGRGITDTFLDKFLEEFEINQFDLQGKQTYTLSEPTVIYKSDPKDVAAIADKDALIAAKEEVNTMLRDKIKELEAKLHDQAVGLRSAPAADTPSVGGCQASRE